MKKHLYASALLALLAGTALSTSVRAAEVAVAQDNQAAKAPTSSMLLQINDLSMRIDLMKSQIDTFNSTHTCVCPPPPPPPSNTHGGQSWWESDDGIHWQNSMSVQNGGSGNTTGGFHKDSMGDVKFHPF